MPRTFVEVSSFGALEAQLGHGQDAAKLAQDYLQDYGTAAPTEVPLTHNTEIKLGPVPSWSNG